MWPQHMMSWRNNVCVRHSGTAMRQEQHPEQQEQGQKHAQEQAQARIRQEEQAQAQLERVGLAGSHQ